jgi:hypothetical protein
MAEQEEPVRRKVAVKVIKQGMDTKNVIARFEAERHALALMDHPNIARVLDAGVTATGRPYFVMELVCGVTITGYCDRHNLDISRRLELFINICHAVQHAHQKGIIHRDLKPSNILVTLQDGVPVPKVIDFGIAKAVAGRLADAAVVTACEQIIGTPAYMSPEQAQMNGLDVDTRSDIYSLGVLLYELLTGRTPFDGKELAQLGPDEMRRRLRETEPQRPSALLSTLHGPELLATAEHRQAEPPRLISQIRGDLDWIVMKALEKDRTRRYETANGLAMDLERYLANEPVVARPPSRLYRFQKLVHRNKLMFASSATVLLTLVAGLGTATRAFLSEREARREQIVLRERAQQAERREVEARRLAEAGEAREKINQAAILVSQEKFEEASQKLDEVKTPPPMPSFDGIATYRRLGEWLARHGRWRDAGDRFKALMEIDKLDPWGTVTLDYQACGVVLAESGDRGGYQQFCQAAIARYGATKNGDEAARILKSCLLFPVQGAEISRLNPMARVVGGTFTSFSASGSNGWAAIPLSLWQYRCGNYAGANDWAEQGLAHSEASSALNATLRGIQATTSPMLPRRAIKSARLIRSSRQRWAKVWAMATGCRVTGSIGALRKSLSAKGWRWSATSRGQEGRSIRRARPPSDRPDDRLHWWPPPPPLQHGPVWIGCGCFAGKPAEFQTSPPGEF